MVNAVPAITARAFNLACDLFASAVRRFSASASGEPMRSLRSAASGATRLASHPRLGIHRSGPRAAQPVRGANGAAGASLLLRQPAALRAGDGGGALARTISPGLANARLAPNGAGPGAHAPERTVALIQSARTRAAAGARAAAFLRPTTAGGDGMPSVRHSFGAGTFAGNTQTAPIIINYAPDLVIHADGPADQADLRQRVLAILERHARELYEALARETVRRRRMQFGAAAGAGL